MPTKVTAKLLGVSVTELASKRVVGRQISKKYATKATTKIVLNQGRQISKKYGTKKLAQVGGREVLEGGFGRFTAPKVISTISKKPEANNARPPRINEYSVPMP